jgi:hypothetical protein
MQNANRTNETLGQFWRVERDRLHCAERWPYSPYKRAVLATVHSALKRLEATAAEPLTLQPAQSVQPGEPRRR